MLLSTSPGVPFLVWFNNSDQPTGFYWSYTHTHTFTPHTHTHTHTFTPHTHTHTPPVPAIPPPSSVELEFINISAVLVSWSYPFQDVPPPIQFLLQCSKDGGPYQNVTKLMNSTQWVFGHMLLSAYYQFRVRAFHRGVASEPSQPSYSFLNGITGEVVHKTFVRKTSRVPRPHPLTRRNGLVNQVKFLGLPHAFVTV